jgi:hypothetical protein
MQSEKNGKFMNLPGQSTNKRTKENLQIWPLFLPRNPAMVHHQWYRHNGSYYLFHVLMKEMHREDLN